MFASRRTRIAVYVSGSVLAVWMLFALMQLVFFARYGF